MREGKNVVSSVERASTFPFFSTSKPLLPMAHDSAMRDGSTAAVSEQGHGKGAATAAGIKRAGKTVNAPKAPSVPGKLYFGFCEEVIRALQKIVGQGGGDATGEGRGLCKIEFDATTNLPVTPIQVPFMQSESVMYSDSWACYDPLPATSNALFQLSPKFNLLKLRLAVGGSCLCDRAYRRGTGPAGMAGCRWQFLLAQRISFSTHVPVDEAGGQVRISLRGSVSTLLMS